MTTPIGDISIQLGSGLLNRTHKAVGAQQVDGTRHRPAAGGAVQGAGTTSSGAAPTLPHGSNPSVSRAGAAGVNGLAGAVEAMTQRGQLDPQTLTRLAKLDEASRAFEQIFVRQLLKSAKVGSGGNYASMSVDALARGVSEGGGLGLARRIRDTMIRTEFPKLASNPELASALQSIEGEGRPSRID